MEHRNHSRSTGAAPPTLVERYIRSLIPSSDAELLNRFLNCADSEAFAEIVARHGPMVMGAARRGTRQKTDQEDVFQATFMLLARDARKIRERDRLAGWLYQVACRASRKCRRRPMAEMTDAHADVRSANDPAEAAGWRELAGAVDAELQRLPDELRTPLVICLLEGATQQEAAFRLGWTFSTLRRRFDHGRTLLRQRLERRGHAPFALGPLTIPSSVALGAVPPALAHMVASFATAGASTALISATAIPLLSSTAFTMKTTALAAACILGLGVAALSATSTAQPPAPPAKPQVEVPKGTAQAEPKPVADTQPEKAEMRFRVVDEKGKPLAGAELHFGLWAGKGEKIPNAKTDAEGMAVITRPTKIQILRVWCSAKGCATLFRGWESGTQDSNNPLPVEFVIPMPKGTTIGGQIVDAGGRGIAGAKVEVAAHDVPKGDLPDELSYSPWLSNGSDAVRTDGEGRWNLNNVPAPARQLTVSVNHPDYISDQGRVGVNLQKEQGVTIALLRAKEAVIRMTPGARLSGTVTDAGGKSLPKAVVVFHDQPYNHPGMEVLTDERGYYTLPTLKPGKHLLTVVAVGHAPMMREIEVPAGPREENFRLEAGHSLKVKVVDENGRPVNAKFTIDSWRGRKSIYTHRHPNVIDMKIPDTTGADGIYEWSWAPADAVKFAVLPEGGLRRELELTATAAVQTITVKAAHSLSGHVTDAKTGRPIPKFLVTQIIEFSPDNLVGWRQSHSSAEGEAGRFRMPFDESDRDYRVLIEAEGYRSAISKPALIKNKIREQDFALEPAAPVRGRVLDASGKPQVGIKVALANSFQRVELKEQFYQQKSITDSNGTFKFPAQPQDFALVAQGPAGWVRRDFKADETAAGDMTLKAWAGVRGTLWQDGKPVPDYDISVFAIPHGERGLPKVYADSHVKTDGAGSFAFDRFPAGPLHLMARLGPWEDSPLTSGEIVPLSPKPGEKIAIDLGRGGAKLTGQIRLTGEVPKDLDFRYSLNYLIKRTPEFALPAKADGKPLDLDKAVALPTFESNSFPAHRRFFVKPRPGGQFAIHGVPAGDYWFALRVYEKPAGCLVDPVAVKAVPITVTAAQAAADEILLPDIEVTVRPLPKVGQPLPVVALTDADGKAIGLAEYRGRYLLLHGWAGWCAACAKDYPALRKLAEELPKEKAALIGLNFDPKVDVARSGTAKNVFAWPQALVSTGDKGAAERWMIGSIPLYMVVAPDGTLALRTYSFVEAAEFLKGRLAK